jgi:hypothetical protein
MNNYKQQRQKAILEVLQRDEFRESFTAQALEIIYRHGRSEDLIDAIFDAGAKLKTQRDSATKIK